MQLVLAALSKLVAPLYAVHAITMPHTQILTGAQLTLHLQRFGMRVF